MPFAQASQLTDVETGLLYVSLAVYLGATVVGLRLVRGDRPGRPLRRMLGIGTAVLSALLVAMAFRSGGPPMGHRYEILLGVAWCVAVAAWFLSRRESQRFVAAVAAPTLTMLVFFALILVPSASAGTIGPGAGKLTHILLAVLGFAAFAFAAGIGVLYLWQIRVVKKNPSAAVAGRMPPLEVLDRLNFQAAAFGFPLLGLSVLGGWLFLSSNLEWNWWLDPTVLATLTGMLVYVVLFGARAFLGWRGRRVALLTVVGFLVMVLGYWLAAYCTSASGFHGT